MIMTDQDHDGSHIKGLIINFLHCYWPKLLKQGGFLREFVTPIVKVTRNKTSTPFFTLKEYTDWREKMGSTASSFQIKYYKGLGTSTSTEAKQYFSDLRSTSSPSSGLATRRVAHRARLRQVDGRRA